MDNIKYVVTDYNRTNTMFIFPANVYHSKFAKMFGTPISAGFIDIKNKRCYGQSTSLKLKSNPKVDNILLGILLREED